MIQVLLDGIQRQSRHEALTTVKEWLDVASVEQQHSVEQQYERSCEDRLDGTCQWIFNHAQYKQWIDKQAADGLSKVFWLNGPAGHGKTVLCGKVIQQLKSQPEVTVAYFFSSSYASSGGNPDMIVRYWISQIIREDQDILDLVLGFSQRKDASRIAFQAEIWSLFEMIVKSSPFYFVVDGYDEYSRLNDERAKFLQKLIEVISGTETRVFIASRDELDIRAEILHEPVATGLRMLECKVIVESIRSDIALFSKSVVDEKLSNKSEEIRTDLASLLAEKCAGMFLWIKLHKEQLRGGKNRRQLENIVQNMPLGLLHTYERNWERITNRPDEERQRAQAILRWTLFASRPLTVKEITEVLIIDLNSPNVLQLDDLPDSIDDEYARGEIVEMCESLIELRAKASDTMTGAKTIHFVHPSVREFVLSTLDSMQGVPQHLSAKFDAGPHHSVLAKTCLKYLNTRTAWYALGEEREPIYYRPFIGYASSSWFIHADQASKRDEEVISLTVELLQQENPNFINWKKTCNSAEGYTDSWYGGNTTPFYYCARFNLVKAMTRIYRDHQAWLNSVGGAFGTALQAACANGHVAIVDQLLEWNADVNLVAGRYHTALHAAAGRGAKAIVGRLLSAKAKPNVQDYIGETPLHAVAKYEKFLAPQESSSGATIDAAPTTSNQGKLDFAGANDHSDVAKLLLQHGASHSIVNLSGEGPLNIAAFTGNSEVVKALLEYGASHSTTDKDGVTPLSIAAGYGHTSVVKLLLEHGANPSATNQGGFTPLICAVDENHLEIVRLLLEHKADHSMADLAGFTPINAAADFGHLEMVKLLLDYGADPSIPNNKKTSPLVSAVAKGHADVVRVLIEQGVELSLPNKKGLTPVHVAAGNGFLEIMDILLRQGANYSMPSNAGLTPINTAATAGHLEAVKMLLEKNADHSITDGEGWTPLNGAASNGHAKVVKLLLEYHASHSIPNSDGGTPLHYAISHGHVEVVQILLDEGANIFTRSTRGWTPIHSASFQGHAGLVKMLLDRGLSSTSPTDSGLTPLGSAALGGHVDVIKLLIEHNADISTADNEGWSPLSNAASKGHLEVVRLLLDQGADQSTPTNKGPVPLHVAASEGHLEVVRYLLEHKAKPNMRGENGWTSLRYAAHNGHTEVIKLLIAHGADFSIHSTTMRSALSDAAIEGHVNVVELLLGLGADYSTPDDDGWTPLNGAARQGHTKVVSLLLEHGADHSAPNKQGFFPLHFAALQGSTETAKLLLDAGADHSTPDNSGWTPLNDAARQGHTKVVSLLLEHGADHSVPNKQGLFPLHSAAIQGSTETAKLLLDAGANTSARDNWGITPLINAVCNNKCSVASLLVRSGADLSAVDHHGYSPMAYAASYGHIEMVRMLRSMGVDGFKRDENNCGPFEYAARDGHLLVVLDLLEHGVSPIAEGDGSAPALNLACIEGNLDVVKLLIDYNPLLSGRGLSHTVASGSLVDIDLESRVIYSQGILREALQLALANRQEDVSLFLLEQDIYLDHLGGSYGSFIGAASYGGSVELLEIVAGKLNCTFREVDDQGRIPLHLAASSGQAPLVAHILENSGNYDIADRGGATFLHHAASGACLDVIKQAVKMLPVNTSQSIGWSPLHWACIKGDLIVVKYLLDLGYEEYEVETFEPAGRWTPLKIAFYHYNTHLQQIRASSLIEYFRNEGSNDAISSPRIVPESKKICNRCFHVRAAHLDLMTSFHTILGNIRSHIQVLCLLHF